MEFVAPIAFLLYILGCYFWGGHFPFYKFELYAGAATRKSGAVPVFLVDGKEAEIWTCHRFSGLDPDAFLPSHIPTSVTWMVEEAARWVRERPAEGDAVGPLSVSFGFRLISVDDGGEIQESMTIVQRGRAWMI